jgi:hypothetical protein
MCPESGDRLVVQNRVVSVTLVLVSRIVTRYAAWVIVSFRHKGLEWLYRDGSKKGVQPAHVPKLLRVLSALDVAQIPEDLAVPAFRTHALKVTWLGTGRSG